MQGKRQLVVFTGVLLSLLLLGNFIIWGCAGSAGQAGMSAEREAAIQDSLYRVHKSELARWWSFGHEPFKQGDYEKAKFYFKRVAEKDTSNIYQKALYSLLGTCYLRLGKPDSAEWAYTIGRERNPNNPWFYNSLGYIYKNSDRSEEAIDMYMKLTEMEPDTARHYIELGQIYIGNDMREEAIGAFQQAIALNPNDIESQERLNNLLTVSGDVDAVIAQRESMVEQFPDNMSYRQDLANTYHQVGEFEKALVHLETVRNAEPDNVPALSLLADCYQQLESFPKAIDVYNVILAKNPQDKQTLCNLAVAQTSLGRFSTARRTANKALAIDSDYGWAFLARGHVYEQAAEKCVDAAGGKMSYNDKLVYKKAYDEYARARSDFETKSEAEKRMKYLETLIPTSEDKFFHKNQTEPEGSCYQWI